MTIPHCPGSARPWLRSLTLASIAAIGMAADKSDINSLSPWRERIEGVAPAIASGGYGSHGSIILGKTVPQRIPAGNVVLIKVADFQTIEFRPGVEVSGYLEAYDADVIVSHMYFGTNDPATPEELAQAEERLQAIETRLQQEEAAEAARRASLTARQRAAEDAARIRRFGLTFSEFEAEATAILRERMIFSTLLRLNAGLLAVEVLVMTYNYMSSLPPVDPNLIDLRLPDVVGLLGINAFSNADFGFGDRMGPDGGWGSLGFGQGYGESGFGGIGVGSAGTGDSGGGNGAGSGSGSSAGAGGNAGGRGGDSGGIGGHGAGL